MPKRHPLHAICPYFAMFPESFVREHVDMLSKKGDWVSDPSADVALLFLNRWFWAKCSRL